MKNDNTKIVTRFAPSPTGHLHMGSVRTALYAYLFARQNGGRFILRIEDTDRERSKKEFDEAIVKSLEWLGMDYDNKDNIWRQSERGSCYKKYIETLLASDKAYVSKEDVSSAEGGAPKRSEVIRFRNPNKKVSFSDMIRGEIEFDTTELGDFVIAKSVEEPVFHMAVVVDDFETGITHVIRGEDHISNTPRQILIQEAIGAPRPVYAHLPLVLAPDRTKLSKRKHGQLVSLDYYRQLGYLPEALINFLVLIGWNPGDEREIFEMKDLLGLFDITKIQKAGGIFNVEKLDWINKEHMNRRTDTEPKIIEELVSIFSLTDELVAKKTAPIVRERISKFGDIKILAESGELNFFFKQPVWKKESFIWKGKGTFVETSDRLKKLVDIISSVPEEKFDKDGLKNAIWPFAEQMGRGGVLWPMRYALSGLEKSPDPFVIAEAVGKAETLKRLNLSVEFLKDA